MSPRVSIIIPCYRHAHYLAEAVESVVAQTFSDWEIIIVNDGSPDDTSVVARQLIARHSGKRLSLIEQANRGLPGARNAGIERSQAQYILPLDADDRLHEQFLEKTVGLLDANPHISIAYTDQHRFGAVDDVLTLREYDFGLLRTQNIFAYCSLYRRQAWVDAAGYNPNMTAYEDWDFWISCAEKGHVAHRVPVPLFYYRVSGDGMYARAQQRDHELRARLALNHPNVYGEAERARARQILGLQEAVDGSRIVAIISAHNEGDVIYHVIGDLIENGVQVYFMDHCSTDNTVAEASKWLGKGLLHIERFPQECGYPERNQREMVWLDILKRKAELAGRLGAGWYLHADADEFRESPWPGLSLSQAIQRVDLLGYSAINFEVLNFRATDDGFVPGTDVRKHLTRYERAQIYDSVQIKCWKNLGVPVDLTVNGGHAVFFEGRRVFPIPFILRHYPIRGETHGRRKVLQERLPRFAAEEREKGFHCQYTEDAQYLWDPSGLVVYDANEVRVDLLTRASQDIVTVLALQGRDMAVEPLQPAALGPWLQRRLGLPRPPSPDLIMSTVPLVKQLVAAHEKNQPVNLDGNVLPIVAAMLDATAARCRLAADMGWAAIYANIGEQLKRVQIPPRILIVAAHLPAPGSASAELRLLHIVRLMRRRGCQVHVLSVVAADVDIQRTVQTLTEMGVSYTAGDPARAVAMGWIMKAPQPDLAALLRQGRFDIAWLHTAQIAALYMDDIRALSPSTRIIADTVDAEFVRLQRAVAFQEATSDAVAKARERELEVCRKADLSIAVTPADRDALLAEDSSLKVRVLPNMHYVAQEPAALEQRSGLIFVGSFMHKPNVDAMLWFHADIWPLLRERLPQVRIYVVGGRAPESIEAMRSPQIEVTGWVAETAPLLDRCRVSIAPLRYGSGMKGKVGEALSRGLPTVLTPIAAEGMGLESGVHYLSASTPQEFADAVVRLHTDDALWRTLSAAGLQHMRRCYTPATVDGTLQEILQSQATPGGKM